MSSFEVALQMFLKSVLAHSKSFGQSISAMILWILSSWYFSILTYLLFHLTAISAFGQHEADHDSSHSE